MPDPSDGSASWGEGLTSDSEIPFARLHREGRVVGDRSDQRQNSTRLWMGRSGQLSKRPIEANVTSERCYYELAASQLRIDLPNDDERGRVALGLG